MSLKALLLDMDGTLADSDPLHRRAFAETLRPYGIVVDAEFYRTRISGRVNAAIFAELLPDRDPTEHARLAAAKEAAFRAIDDPIEPVAGLVALLDWARAGGLHLALVTNAPMANVRHTLRALELAAYFPVQVSGEDLARGKPDPLPYRTALDRLGVRAEQAVAFEDSRSGVRSAKAAGLFTVGVLTGQSADTLRAEGADVVIRDFLDESLWRHLRRSVEVPS